LQRVFDAGLAPPPALYSLRLRLSTPKISLFSNYFFIIKQALFSYVKNPLYSQRLFACMLQSSGLEYAYQKTTALGNRYGSLIDIAPLIGYTTHHSPSSCCV
jgi:hypothetical protein